MDTDYIEIMYLYHLIEIDISLYLSIVKQLLAFCAVINMLLCEIISQ